MSFLQSGQSILHYRILGKIGEGGMGEVYKAEDLKLGRQVAIKVLPPEATKDPIARHRFIQEARSASALNHPNIVTIHAIEQVNGVDFIVMEYIEGDSLKAEVERSPLPFQRLLDIGCQVADALAAAHAIGLIHRDVKSANILVTPRGLAKVLDFGLAKMTKPLPVEVVEDGNTLPAGLTGRGVIVGTVSYMSPEQTRGELLDGRSDIFSLGAVLYEAATGRPAFNGPSMLSIMHEIATVDPPRPSSMRRDLPREFDLLLERTLSKDKDQRYASAQELAEALQQLRGSAADGVPAFATTPALEEPEPAAAFVGREPELKRLAESLRQAVDGTGRIVFLAGGPGSGKSALADEFLRGARKVFPGLIYGRGRCVEQYGTGETYLPFLDALSGMLSGPGRVRLMAALRTNAPTWCLQFPAIFTSSGEQLQRETIGATKDRMLRELGDALAAISTATPLALVLEDLHWADPSSIDLVRHLSQRIASQRLLIVGTFRPEDLDIAHHPLKKCKSEMQARKLCDEVALGPLAEDHLVAYLDAQFSPNNFAHELGALILRKTDGHPLFATSLVQFLTERGDIARIGDRWELARPLSEMDLEAPEGVRSMIRKKVEALEEEDRRALQYATVEGDEFLSTVLAEMLGVDDLALEERLDRLDKVHRLIQTLGEEDLPDGALATRYRFANRLYQTVLYGDLVAKRRVLLHRQAGEQLVKHYGEKASRIAMRLAVHFERGRDFARACDFLIQAGDNASRLYANAEAEEHYTHAARLLDRLPPEEQPQRYVTIYLKRGVATRAMGRFPRAADDFRRMVERARETGPPATLCLGINALRHTLLFSHRTDEMALYDEEALRAAAEAGSEALRLQTLALTALRGVCYGELEEAKKVLDEIIPAAAAIQYKPGMLSGNGFRGTVAFFQSEYEHAETLLLETRRLASELRDGFQLLGSFFFLGLVQANRGRISDALATLREGEEMARRNNDHFWVARLPNSIGWIYREMQDFRRAREFDEQGLVMAREDKVLEAEANALINVGLDCTHAGDYDKTQAAFRDVEAIFAHDAWNRWRYNMRLQSAACEHWLCRGDLQRAGEYAGHLLEMAMRHDARKYMAIAHQLLAQIAAARGDLSAAQTEIDSAIEQARSRPMPLAAWKVYATAGRLRLRAADSDGAREAFAQSAEVIREIAAQVREEDLRAGFLNSAAVREVHVAH